MLTFLSLSAENDPVTAPATRGQGNLLVSGTPPSVTRAPLAPDGGATALGACLDAPRARRAMLLGRFGERLSGPRNLAHLVSSSLVFPREGMLFATTALDALLTSGQTFLGDGGAYGPGLGRGLG